MIYGKLVRDKIVNIIQAKPGTKVVHRTLTKEEYDRELKRKLMEEVIEFFESGTGNVDELVDIMQVCYSIANTKCSPRMWG